MPKKVFLGVVTGNGTAKTRRVEITRRVPHPIYGKYIRRRTVCITHDEDDTSHRGDLVEIIECRPMSKTKRWKLVRVVEASKFQDVVRKRAQAGDEEAQQLLAKSGEETPS